VAPAASGAAGGAQEEADRLRAELQEQRAACAEATNQLQRERSARQAADTRIQELQRELEQERRARGEAEDARAAAIVRMRQAEEELQREQSERQLAERVGQEGARASAGARLEGLVVACISTASHSELEAATEGFAQERILGRGGFGPVYRGVWRDRNSAIKVLDATSMQGAKEFLKEINVLGNYRHQNLLPLLGFCISKEGSSVFCALIYPQMRVSLEDALQQSARSQPGSDAILSASHRLVIAMDAAAGLAYLHSASNEKPAILHRDIKSSNILLDADNRARISDVGLARPMEGGVTQTGGLGTFGYMDIVYLTTGEFSPPSDVFSLGVVFLELLTGEAACDSGKRPPILHARVGPRLLQDATAVCDALARWPAPMAAQFASIAKDCICPDSTSRPTSQAVLERLSLMVAQAEPQQPQQPPAARECIICMDAPRNSRLRPCCHVVLCDMCAAAVLPRNSGCPVCRARIQTYDVGDFNATFVPV
jgi:hypothetical protein